MPMFIALAAAGREVRVEVIEEVRDITRTYGADIGDAKRAAVGELARIDRDAARQKEIMQVIEGEAANPAGVDRICLLYTSRCV